MATPDHITEELARLRRRIVGDSDVVLLVPSGRRSIKVILPVAAATWLRDQLIEAVGAPAPRVRRAVRLKRGKWQQGRA
jgi:hypothetical protein